ncbi:diaminohydroxyphosphoribosylaminopyrimidine deaminase / 5-amino-6-(5-phosphoribosylamino)uracil reductase [Caminicella sporogenes DSM 14501]|uniref:Riboflavin biosynthesis protein RibD n=1 Tax=Caminicella sporogenes DSM 14501 TaxID=1121266 RepID=A0A1M6TFH1_9FIRM|nr:bifunctional diaminohydroxyphosphoribosylaminopyrimidine deaminase/5-amino-6-(5-phosphoribosylamino)uracil reductase RibD [Caminicella sporogenes]RKD24926.1 riboflavin biosynthesis protein RibD [Caminicella sporogenes]SHK55782.1 diaminohydroxyphosphoribosylaminopyrimidine deaminase / 5-amino-6-(5-phosphoribosylamino)uracil reductase [Caminicella sporogenes DSM 14501]
MNTKFMERAFQLAKKGEGFVNPNPMVGAVIVKNNTIIGEGYHKYFGGNHAEVEALNSIIDSPEGATMYVTLEPCSHFGKTPPCTDAIIKSGIKKVVISMLDPNPLVSGRGVKKLKDNGIEVITGILEDKAKKLNEIFIKYITKKIPFCLMKSAMSLDGKIATKFSDSKWITNKFSRQYVHKLRHKYSAIMVGINTILIDDPLLTARIPNFKAKNPIRIIVDTNCKIPLDSKVVKTISKAKTIIATTNLAPEEKIDKLKEKGVDVLIIPTKDNRVDLKKLMENLGQMGIDSVLLEGGGTLNYSALKTGIVDKINFFIAPKIIGGYLAKTAVEGDGASLVKDSFSIKNISIKTFEDDIMIEGYVNTSFTF